MTADIVHELNDEARSCINLADGAQNAIVNERENRLAMQFSRAAAEIVRLRGEVAALLEDPDEAELAYRCGDPDSDAIAPAEAKDPAPAMPNGVEGLVAKWRAEADEMPVSYRNDESRGYNNALYHLADELEAALRAADNRDAAGVCDRMRDLLLERRNRLMNSFGGTPYEDGRVQQQIDAIDEQLRPAPAAVPAGEVCGTCNGVGMIGGHRGQTPDSFEQWAEDCPDCTPQPADGEAVGTVMVVPSDDSAPVQIGWHRDIPPVGTKLYTTPPAPVQAAPQEGEAYQPVRFGGIRRPSDEALAAAFWEHRQRENSLPADLCDSRLVKFGNDIVRRARELAPYLAAHPSACELGAVRIPVETLKTWRTLVCVEPSAVQGEISDVLREAALQHRGDSQEVGRG